MHIFHKHFKYNDSWMWCDWVRHQPIFGFPHLRIASVHQDLYFIFELTWGKLHWYWTTGNVKHKAQKGERKMTDKVQKIREEVERLKSLIGNNSFLSDYEKGCNDGREDMCEELLTFIDSLQKEPINKVWHDASEKHERENLLVETNDGRIIHRQTINNYGMVKRWAYTSDLLNLDNLCNFGKNSQELVSDDLSAEIDYLSKRYPEVSFAKLSRIAAHIAKWQKDNTIRKVAKWLYANFYISKEYVSETSILPIPKYAHNATMGQFISEFINHMKKG